MTKFNTVKRKANVGERILIVDVKLGSIEIGDIGEVISVDDGGVDAFIREAMRPVYHSEYEVIKEASGMKVQKRGSLLVKAVPTPDYQETIGFTENEDGTYSLHFSKMPGLVFVSYDGVGTFDQLFVHGDFKAEAQRIKIDSAVGEITKYTIESTPVIKTEVATLHAGETIIPKPKTPQQQRDVLTRERIIEQAKRDVAELSQGTESKGRVYYVDGFGCYAEFFVNNEKRAVTVLLKGYSSEKVRAKGIAKCAPTDCFNAHIGRAIALRRALGLEVPAEYLNAPQPTEVRVGDVVCGNYEEGYYKLTKRFTLTSVNDEDGGFNYAENEDDWIEHAQIGAIIDDTRENEPKAVAN